MTTKKIEPTVHEEEEVVEKKVIKEIEQKQPSEIDILKAELAELRLMVRGSSLSEKKEEEHETKVSPDDYITIMSLVPYTLNLSTKGGGQGSIKRFTKFGETKKILYRELVDIMDAHPNFLEAGYFYILSREVIRQHGLDELYETILVKEKLEEIVSTDSNDCIELYKSANPYQKEVIIDLLVQRVFESKDSVNMNVIDRISRDSGVNIIQKAEVRQEILDAKEQEEKGKE